MQNFVVDNTTCSQPGVFDGENATLLNEVVCEHLLRQGRLDIAEQMTKVSKPCFLGCDFLIQFLVGIFSTQIMFNLFKSNHLKYFNL